MLQPSVLAIVAHPDDAELAMGGTLTLLARSGYEVNVLIASVPTVRPTREKELAASAEILGFKTKILERDEMWWVEDVPLHELVTAFDKEINRTKPQIIFTHWIDDTHRDHQIVARAAFAAARRRYLDFFMSGPVSLGAPHFSTFSPDTFVDVSSTIDTLLEGIEQYQSQIHGRHYIRDLKARASYFGAKINKEYAEGFICVQRQWQITPLGLHTDITVQEERELTVA